MAVTVRFIADVVNWLSGLGKSEEAVDDNVAALEDLMKQAIELGTQAGRTSDEIASDFSKAFGTPLDQAQRAVREVLDETKDLGDAASDAGREASTGLDKIGSAASDADSDVSKLSGTADDVGSSMTELGSIARDVLSGDIGTAATGAVDALGSIATAAGLGGAAGGAIIGALSGLVGAMIDELTKFAEMSSEVKQGVINDFIELGNGLDQAAIDRRMKEALNTEEGRRQVQLLADLLGTDLPTALLVLGGDFETAGVSVQEAMQAIADAPGNVRIDDYNALKATLEGLSDGLKEGPQYADATAAALSRVAIASAEAAVAAGDATRTVDEFGNTVYQLPDGKVVVVDAETGQAVTDITTVQDLELYSKTVKVYADTSEALRDINYLNSLRLTPKTQTINTKVVGEGTVLKPGYGWQP